MIKTLEEKSDDYYAYLDTLMFAWDKAEENGHYDPVDDMSRGYHYSILKTPDYEKADFYMSRGIKTQGTELEDEVYILLYYYNLYSLWYLEQDVEEKEVLKKRCLSEYLELSKLINIHYSSNTQSTLTKYVAHVITSCNDLAYLVTPYLASLPENNADKKTALMNLGQLFIAHQCEDLDVFDQLADSITTYDPYAFDPWPDPIPCSERIPNYKELQRETSDEVKKNEIQYSIADCYLQKGSYHKAYTAAKSVTGELKNKALQIQAICVAATANSCGESTFERKCNYLYASTLMRQAGVDDSKYDAMAPQLESVYKNQSETVVLPCWGVTIDLATREIISEADH
ncbi:MAG: hypothetical protein NXI10_16270 [bacterium]|nr:hypothetical protein [bacterium]